MSSTERAPEPTMEEILASIRRIISEDESGSAGPREAAASSRDEGFEPVESEADDQIISDIARVLSGAQQTPAEEEEEILDLTSELGGLEIVEETVVEVVEEAVPVETLAEAEIIAMPEMPEPVAEPAPAPEPAPEPMAEAAPEPPIAPSEPVAAAAPPSPASASEEAASALERAIAALRAGQLPTSISEFSAQPQPPEPPEPFYVAPEPEPQPEPKPFYVAPEPEPEPEPELVLTEFETEAVVEEPVGAEPASEAEAPSEWEGEATPWAAAAEPSIEPERPSLRSNGHSADDADNPKTLEDSVKDMLRPMLRKWLDENMPRMVTAALKDELRNNPARFQRD